MKFGMHISTQEAVNSGWVQKFSTQPVALVLAVGIGGEIPRTLQVAQLCPHARLIYRAWSYGDLGSSDHFEWYKHGTDPLPLIRAHEPCFDAFRGINVSYQLWNETGHDNWKDFIAFNTNYVNEMSKRGLSCSVLGLGPGFPTGSRDEIRQKWQQARPLFEAINASPVTHVINLHEYYVYPIKNSVPYLAGRYRWLLEDLAEMGLLTDKIKIFCGEHGWADPAVLDPRQPPNPANGYRGFILKGITPEQLADDLVETLNSVYNDPHFIGTCHFCVGDSGGWAEFDLLKELRILERIYSKMDTWILVPTPETNFKVTADVLNVRFAPTLTGQVISQKHNGDVIKTNGYVDFDGFRWRQLTNSEGYCAEVNLTDSTMRFLQEVTDWKKQIIDLIDHIQTELEEVEALIGGV